MKARAIEDAKRLPRAFGWGNGTGAINTSVGKLLGDEWLIGL